MDIKNDDVLNNIIEMQDRENIKNIRNHIDKIFIEHINKDESRFSRFNFEEFLLLYLYNILNEKTEKIINENEK